MKTNDNDVRIHKTHKTQIRLQKHVILAFIDKYQLCEVALLISSNPNPQFNFIAE